MFSRANERGIADSIGALPSKYERTVKYTGEKVNHGEISLLRRKLVDNRYSNVAFYMMYNRAMKNGLPLGDVKENNLQYMIPDDVYFMINSPQQNVSLTLWDKYIHLSSIDKNLKKPYPLMPYACMDTRIGMWVDSITPDKGRVGFMNTEDGKGKGEIDERTYIKEYEQSFPSHAGEHR